MTNLLVSNVCNLACPYCFAAPEMDVGTGQFISLTDFAAALDYLDRSGIDQVRLLGGEPTLHPQFSELVQMSLDRGKTLLVFTNGLIPPKALQAIAQIPPERCIVLVNANASSIHLTEEAILAKRKSAVAALGSRCRLGFTIHTPRFDLAPLVRLIEETGPERCIRLGLAQPTGDSNRDIHPKQYPLLGSRIAVFAEKAAEKGIRLEMDCGFVRCMFSDEDLQRLAAAGASLSWRCSPVIDLGIDGTAFHCFPLYSLGGIPQANRLDAATVRAQLENRVTKFRSFGIYEECAGCGFRLSAGCSGGCLAWKIRRASWRPWQAALPKAIAVRMTELIVSSPLSKER